MCICEYILASVWENNGVLGDRTVWEKLYVSIRMLGCDDACWRMYGLVKREWQDRYFGGTADTIKFW